MRGTTLVAPTRRGLLLVSHAVDAKGNGAAGAYVQDGKGLFRFIEGLVTSFDVSPNGCRLAVAIADRSREKMVIPWIKVVSLCLKDTSDGTNSIYQRASNP